MTNCRELRMILGGARCLLICGVFAIFAGCATKEIDPQWQALIDKPAWVAGEAGKYPSNLFISGHGVSADLQVAKAQAMQAVTQACYAIISTGIENHLAPTSITAFGQQSVMKFQKKFYRDRIMPRRYIAEIWQDPSSKSFHVLSVIDRHRVAKTFQQEIEHLDEQISRVMEKSRQQADSLQRIAMINIAIEKYNERQQLSATTKMLYPGISKINGNWNSVQLQAQISQNLSSTIIKPVLEEFDPLLLEALADGVRSAGFDVNYDANPDYILKASFRREQIKWNDGVYTLQGKLVLVLWDGQMNGQVRGKANWPIEVTSIDRNDLEQALLDAIKVSHQQNLRSAFIQFETN